jgi:hypothetical protein
MLRGLALAQARTRANAYAASPSNPHRVAVRGIASKAVERKSEPAVLPEAPLAGTPLDKLMLDTTGRNTSQIFVEGKIPWPCFMPSSISQASSSNPHFEYFHAEFVEKSLPLNMMLSKCSCNENPTPLLELCIRDRLPSRFANALCPQGQQEARRLVAGRACAYS